MLALLPLSSLRWALYGALGTLALTVAVWAMAGPSKVQLARNAAISQCNEDKLALANASLAEQVKAESAARKAAEDRLKKREEEARFASAAYQDLKQRLDDATKPRPDDAKPFLSPDDPFWVGRVRADKRKP